MFDPEAVSTLRLRQQLTAVRGGGRARPAGSVRWVETQWYRVWSFLSSLQGRSPSPLGDDPGRTGWDRAAGRAGV